MYTPITERASLDRPTERTPDALHRRAHVHLAAVRLDVPRQRLRPDLFAVPAPHEAEAAALGLDAAALAERAVREAISAEKARRWLEENREAIEAHNRWVEEHGLPLAKYRMF